MILTPKEIEITDFARRVERLCDFLLSQVKGTEESGSDDIGVIKELKEDAANLQFNNVALVSNTVKGLDTFMKGLDKEP